MSAWSAIKRTWSAPCPEAGWYPADPITLKSSIEIVGSVLLDRPYKDAPVSNLYYLGRREDLAFEKPIGSNADRRNHVRFWKVLERGQEKRPVWLRARRRKDIAASASANIPPAVTHTYTASQPRRRTRPAHRRPGKCRHGGTRYFPGHRHRPDPDPGRNGGGDLYYTDGEIWVLRLVQRPATSATAPRSRSRARRATEIKDQIWHAVANVMGN